MEENTTTVKEPLLEKTVLSDIEKPKTAEEAPDSYEEKAGFLSKTFFNWMTPILKTGSKRPLDFKDIPKLSKCDTADEIYTKTSSCFEESKKQGKPSIYRAMYKSYGKPFVFAGFLKLIHDIMQFLGPYLLKFILDFMSDKDADMMEGIWLSIALLVSALVQSYCLRNYFFLCYRTGMRMRSTVVTMVYTKSLKLSTKSRTLYSTGQITNLMEVDSQRFQDLTSYLQTLWSGPFQIIVCLGMLYWIMGLSAITGVILILLMIPLSKWLSKHLALVQNDLMKAKDKRLQLTGEVVGGIKVIKLQAWERAFLERLTGLRGVEMTVLRRYAIWNTFNQCIWNMVPILVAAGTFATYTLTGGVLTNSIAFTANSLFNLLSFPLTMFPETINDISEAANSVQRVQAFLLAEEQEHIHIHPDSTHKGIFLSNANFTWPASNRKENSTPTPSESFGLNDISMEIPMNCLVGVTGPVGSGKSSLINACLGEMEIVGGDIFLGGKVAYVPQTSYILNDTLRNNILFNSPFNQEKYDTVIEACALRPDLDILPAGDQTEIGEKGINLSGGQKVRVSLARAVYQDSDIYILDDPLSAVDAHVSKHIFEKCINGILKGKCILLVTHALEYLKYCDNICVMKNGHIVEHGTWDNLINESSLSETRAKGLLKELYDAQLSAHTQKAKESTSDNTPTSPTPLLMAEEESKKNHGNQAAAVISNTDGKLIQKEDRVTGSVGWKVYKQYMNACGGLKWFILLLLLFGFSEGTKAMNSYWITFWDSNAFAQSDYFYLSIYIAIGLVSIIFLCFRYVTIFFTGIRASKSLHYSLLDNILHLPMLFFDTTPQGRIINRFSKDIYTVDQSLPNTIASYFDCLISVICTVIIISVATPWFLIILVLILIYYLYEQKVFINSSREIKRLDSISRSPIYAHFSETLDGIPVIRAFGMQNYFINNNNNKLDYNQRAYFLQFSANCWLGLRLEFAGTLIVFFSSFLAVLGKETGNEQFIGLAALSISYALNVTQTLNWVVRMAADMETQIVSVERINSYAQLPKEAPEHIEGHIPEESWPSRGDITFKNMSMRYRQELEPVLHHINVSIKGEEKVGVVGRTGAGKSSLMLALMRIIELDEGEIDIDNMNISEIGLHDLRSRIAIISQEPVLFSGTIRENIDPFDEYKDSDIWIALERAHMKDVIASSDLGLSSLVEEHGNNYSVGQRQLLCIARALLHHTKIILMDEATASIDVETDLKIQKTMKEEFKDCTVITIAHRIHTIIDSDKVMVLEAGEVKEFEQPALLLEDPNTIFSGLVNKWQSANEQHNPSNDE
ncbi:hypothetical protein WA158_001935 [Blastocystis sp. Blastoise]